MSVSQCVPANTIHNTPPINGSRSPALHLHVKYTNVLIVRGFITAYKASQYGSENIEVSESSDVQTRCTLRLHTSHKGARRRRLNVNLGLLNLAIAVVFLLCYSLIWLWVIFDLYKLSMTPMSQVTLFYQL